MSAYYVVDVVAGVSGDEMAGYMFHVLFYCLCGSFIWCSISVVSVVVVLVNCLFFESRGGCLL